MALLLGLVVQDNQREVLASLQVEELKVSRISHPPQLSI